MGKLKPIGSEKLKGQDKIARIMEIARYNEVAKNEEKHIATNSFSKVAADGNTYAIIQERDGYYLKCGINESELDYASGLMNKKRDRFRSYGAALKRMNLIFKPLNEQYNEGVGDGMYDEMEEQEKFVLNVPDEGGEEETDLDLDVETGDEELDLDLGTEDDMGDEELDLDLDTETEEGGDEEAEMEGFMKPIQKLTGKLGQKLRDVEEELGSADIKYVLNSVISAVELDNLDEDDLEDILDRFEDEETGYGDEEPIDDIDMGEEDIDIDLEGGDEDLEDVEDVEVGDEELAVESLKNRIGNILESYIEKKEETTPQKYLKNRLNIVQNKKNIKTQYETVEQEMGTEKILKENKDLKFAGKTKHDNIILKSANREILVNKNGSVI